MGLSSQPRLQTCRWPSLFVPAGVAVLSEVAACIVAGSPSAVGVLPSAVAVLQSGVVVSQYGAGVYMAAGSGAAVAGSIRAAAPMTFMFKACAVSSDP